MAQRVVFWGGTGQSKVLKEAMSYDGYELVSIVDNREIDKLHDKVVFLKGYDELINWLDQQLSVSEIRCAVAIGGHRGKQRLDLLDQMKSCGLKPLTIIHPTAFISRDSVIEEGCQILANSAVCVNVKVGRASIINTSASVDHDCILGEGVHIGPGAHLAGEISVGNHTFIGTGATVLPGLKIGADVIIGAGAVVTRDVSDCKTLIGNPAKCI